MKSNENQINIFIAYSRRDMDIKNKLINSLLVLERQDLLRIWHDTLIDPGEEWEKNISNAMDNSDIIILLLSSDFFASDYCYGVEMQKSLEKHKYEESIVIPIIARKCLWKSTPLGKIQALPKDGTAVVDRIWHNEDEPYYEIATAIESVSRKAKEQKLIKEKYNELLSESISSAGKKDFIAAFKLITEAFKYWWNPDGIKLYATLTHWITIDELIQIDGRHRGFFDKVNELKYEYPLNDLAGFFDFIHNYYDLESINSFFDFYNHSFYSNRSKPQFDKCKTEINSAILLATTIDLKKINELFKRNLSKLQNFERNTQIVDNWNDRHQCKDEAIDFIYELACQIEIYRKIFEIMPEARKEIESFLDIVKEIHDQISKLIGYHKGADPWERTSLQNKYSIFYKSIWGINDLDEFYSIDAYECNNGDLQVLFEDFFQALEKINSIAENWVNHNFIDNLKYKKDNVGRYIFNIWTLRIHLYPRNRILSLKI